MDDRCMVVRDLMPLVIDEAASEASGRMVEKHMAECRECTAYYQGMRAQLPRAADREAEAASFARNAQKLRRKRRLRILRWVLLGVLVSALLGLAGYTMNYYNRVVMETPMAMADYRLGISRLQNGECSMYVLQREPEIQSRLVIGIEMEEGERVLYIGLKTAKQPDKWWREDNVQEILRVSWHDDGTLYMLENGIEIPVRRICKGIAGGECEVVYEKGGEVPQASDSMGAYYAAKDEYERIDMYASREEAESDDYSDMVQNAYWKMTTQRQLVPEWSPSW